LERGFEIECSEIEPTQASHTCAFYNQDKYIEFFTFFLDRSAAQISLKAVKLRELKVPFDYTIRKLEYSEEYVAVHCISADHQEKDALFFYSIADFQAHGNPFPTYSWDGNRLYNSSSENVALFTFVTSNTMLIRSVSDPENPIHLYKLGSVRIRLKSFDSKKLSGTTVVIKNKFNDNLISLNMLHLVQSKQELEEAIQAKQELQIDLGVFFLLIGPPSAILLFLSCRSEELAEAEQSAGRRSETTQTFEDYPRLTEERKQGNLDDSIGDESLVKEEPEHLK